MTERKKTGNDGEALANAFLLAQGYTVAARNYRYRRQEIDIIAWDQEVLVFVEVKTRSSLDYGHPSGFFGKAQRQRISEAASFYMEEIDYDWEIRFDLVSVYLPPRAKPVLNHFKDVFFPGLF